MYERTWHTHCTGSNGKSFPPPRFTIQENGILTPSYTHIAEEEEEEERTVITGFPHTLLLDSVRIGGGVLREGSPPFSGLTQTLSIRRRSVLLFLLLPGFFKGPRLFTYGGGEKFRRVGSLVRSESRRDLHFFFSVFVSLGQERVKPLL